MNGKAPTSFKRTRVVHELPTYTPRPVLRLDQAGRDVAARTIARPLPDHLALENLVPEEAPHTMAGRARAGIERLARQRQGTP